MDKIIWTKLDKVKMSTMRVLSEPKKKGFKDELKSSRMFWVIAANDSLYN